MKCKQLRTCITLYLETPPRRAMIQIQQQFGFVKRQDNCHNPPTSEVISSVVKADQYPMQLISTADSARNDTQDLDYRGPPGSRRSGSEFRVRDRRSGSRTAVSRSGTDGTTLNPRQSQLSLFTKMIRGISCSSRPRFHTRFT